MADTANKCYVDCPLYNEIKEYNCTAKLRNIKEEYMESKAELLDQIKAVLKSLTKHTNPSVITQRLGWHKDKIEEVCSLFSVKSFVDVLRTIDGIEINKDEHGTTYVTLNKIDNNNSVTKNPSVSAKDEKNIRERTEKLLMLLNSGLYEKEEAIRLALLSAISGESIFFLGPPGTAKSMISTRIHHAFQEGTKYFEYLMNEFSTPDEIFGSVKLKGLDEGVYEKNTNGYLPEANVVFLDEIWKSGPAILNTLLTIINEKKFRNGDKIVKVPLQVLLAASNELPKEKAGLEALYDRFIIRTMVNPVSMENEDSFFALCEKSGKELSIPENMKPNLLTIEEVQGWSDKIKDVFLTDKIKEVIMEIRRELEVKNQEKNREEKEKYYVSDRRWKKIIHLLKTSAFLCDRKEVDLMDIQLVTYCIWSTPKQREEVQKIVKEIVQENGLECSTAVDDIEQQIKVFQTDVDSTWYKRVEEVTHEKPVEKKIGGNRIFYEVEKNNQNIAYISKNFYDNDYYARNYQRRYYYSTNDSNFRDLRSIDYYRDIDDKFIMTHSHYSSDSIKIKTETVVDQKAGLVKDTVIFNNAAAYSATKEKFDSEKYLPIANSIKKELEGLQNFRNNIEKPYSENLFAEQSFKEVITSKIEEEKKKLEDLKLELVKQKSRYEK